jgi:hypothetical protein
MTGKTHKKAKTAELNENCRVIALELQQCLQTSAWLTGWYMVTIA